LQKSLENKLFVAVKILLIRDMYVRKQIIKDNYLDLSDGKDGCHLRVKEEKDTLKTPLIIIETCWAPGFLNIKALDEIISEPEPRRTTEGFVGPRIEGRQVL